MDEAETEYCVSSSCKLEIYVAVYGLCDVTEKVKSLIRPDDQSLTFRVCNDVFGDTWKRHDKIFVIVYSYINTENSDIKKMLLIEGDTLEIRPEAGTALPAAPVAFVSLFGKGTYINTRACEIQCLNVDRAKRIITMNSKTYHYSHFH